MADEEIDMGDLYIDDENIVEEVSDLEENDLSENEEQELAPHEDSDLVFDRHTGSVFSCDLSPTNSELAVSGSEDDCAYLWNTQSGEILFKCEDHKDSVTCVGFNYDGTLLATGDMSGIIQIFKLSTRTKTTSFETTDLAWLRWHSSSNVLLAGTIEGSVWMWHISRGDCKIFAGHGSPSECCQMLSDGARMAIGYGDGSIYIWDMRSALPLHKIINEFAHKEGVTCIDRHSDNLFLSGSVDGTAKLFNPSNGSILGILECSSSKNEDGHQKSVECVGFCKTLPLCATGALDGSLKIWDISTQALRQTCDHDCGIIRLVWDNESPKVYTAAMDGIIRLWDARNGTLDGQWSGHTGEILDLVLSRDGNTIITASDDKTCRIFHVNGPDR